MISGIMMAITATDLSPGINNKAIHAATLSKFEVPMFPVTMDNGNVVDLSEDLVRDLAKRKGVLDTVYITKTDTIKERVTKVKVKKVPVPSNVMEINVQAHRVRTDTIQVPVYYIATQVGTKEGPTGDCISVYEMRKVDKICPDSINSSVKDTNEYHLRKATEL